MQSKRSKIALVLFSPLMLKKMWWWWWCLWKSSPNWKQWPAIAINVPFYFVWFHPNDGSFRWRERQKKNKWETKENTKEDSLSGCPFSFKSLTLDDIQDIQRCTTPRCVYAWVCTNAFEHLNHQIQRLKFESMWAAIGDEGGCALFKRTNKERRKLLSLLLFEFFIKIWRKIWSGFFSTFQKNSTVVIVI